MEGLSERIDLVLQIGYVSFGVEGLSEHVIFVLRVGNWKLGSIHWCAKMTGKT